MKILNKPLLNNFALKHVDSTRALERWTNVVEDASWKTHNDVKKEFPSSDYVGNQRYVFNIKGNKYRLVVVILFTANLITIRFIGKHSDYEKIDCSKI
jgi:mRNA interferase HigB